MGKRGQGEGSIYHRKSDGQWVGSITVDGGKRKVFYGKKRSEVSTKLKKALHDQQQGMLPIGPDQPLAKYLTRWLEDSVKASVRPKTYESYARQVRVHIAPSLGKIKLTKLTAQDLADFYSQMLEEGLAPSSVGRQHAIIHRALEQAMRWYLVPRNVADLVDVPRPDHKEMQPLTREQVGRLLEAAKEDRYYALYVLAISTGMRQSELLGLTWRCVDLDAATVHVVQQLIWSPKQGFSFSEPKTAKGRRAISLPAFAVVALREHRDRQIAERLLASDQWEDLDLVFCNHLGRPFDRGNLVRRSFQPLLEKAGLPKIRFHDLRHTAATLLMMQGAHPKVVQERLGHSTVGVTLDVYSHVLPDMQRDVAARLDALFSAEQMPTATPSPVATWVATEPKVPLAN